MKKVLISMAVVTIVLMAFNRCAEVDYSSPNQVSDEVIGQLVSGGFDVKNIVPIAFEDGYLVEGDIYIRKSELNSLTVGRRMPTVEQYSTNNLVNASGGRLIAIYAAVGGSTGFSNGMIAGLDMAISRYNAENLNISFQRISSSSNADIVMTRLSKRYERQGVLGSAGFPTASGDPYEEIKMSGILESKYGLSTAGIATIIAHEMGHCVGFRHTDYYDRSVSCGGRKSNEGDGGIGANLIPGTPATAVLSDISWMLACTNGGDRPFNNDDQTALDYLY